MGGWKPNHLHRGNSQHTHASTLIPLFTFGFSHVGLNHIRSVKPARKAHWPSLLSINFSPYFITLEQNYIGDAETLTEGRFPSLQYLHLHGAERSKAQSGLSQFPAKL
jgi:hypothetical protein